MSGARDGVVLKLGGSVVTDKASAKLRVAEERIRDLGALRGLVERGLIPLLYGVPAWDAAQGCSILSGDQIAPYVAHGLGLRRVVHGTDVDGVFDADPTANPDARPGHRCDGRRGPVASAPCPPCRAVAAATCSNAPPT